jgi:sugar lactone lactonase YvrE
MNDGRLDPAGRFWAGSMLEGKGNVPNERGSLYSLDGEIRKHLSNIEISNGLAWSPDGQLMYFADSAKNEVFVLDYDLKSGTCCNKQRHIKTTKSEFPDGGTVDSEGNYWSAIWGAGEVRQYNKSGKLLQSISVPTTQASCVAFGGPDMRYLFVTSARKNLSTMLLKNEPEAGNVFIFKTDVQGLQITMPYKLTSNKFTFTTRG